MSPRTGAFIGFLVVALGCVTYNAWVVALAFGFMLTYVVKAITEIGNE